MPGRRAAVLTGACDAIFHVPLLILTTTYQYAGSRWIVAPTGPDCELKRAAESAAAAPSPARAVRRSTLIGDSS